MRFAKMQGVGNDFVVVSEIETIGKNLNQLAKRLCGRRVSIGSDGLLIIGKGLNNAAFSFRMFNPDGSEDMCGNGLRCAALWAYKANLVTVGKFLVSTKDGDRQCELLTVDQKQAQVTVNMGVPQFDADGLPMAGSANTFISQPLNVLDRTFISSVINTGSTHTVVFLDNPVSPSDFEKYSPIFETLPVFPERSSILWTHRLGDNHFSTRIWERGAGETLGCGTGACAVAVAAVMNNRANEAKPIIVTSKGGDLSIKWTDKIWMTGPAELVYEGVV